MKILSIVVTYYPEKELLEKNVNAFIEYVDMVLIWENTPDSDKMQYRYLAGNKIEYCSDGTNSISKALNYGWHYAKRGGYDILLTMDQDSVFEDFELYKKRVEENPLSLNAIYSPRLDETPTPSFPFRIIDWAITSGTLVPISVLNRIGGYDERFPIESIDIDLGLNAKSHSIPTVQFTDVILYHKFGDTVEKTIGSHTVKIRNYSKERLYNIYLSNIIVIRKYKSKNEMKRFCRSYLYRTPRNIILFEKDKLKKLASCFKGLIVGMFCKI